MRRILTAIVGVPTLYFIIRHLPPAAFMGVVAAAIAHGCGELFGLARRRGIRPYRTLGTALSIVIAYSFFDARIGTLEVLASALILVTFASIIRGGASGASEGETPAALASAGVTLMAVLFLGLLMGYMVGLLGDGGERGRDLTVLLFFVVWLADAGAFIVGSLWGRRRFVPTISPAKTVEGAAGALVTAVLAAVAARFSFFRSLPLADAVILGGLLGVAGMMGDLFESMMKRAASMKDSGALFPGHGGILDRTDSLLFAAPILFYYHRYFMA